jgi:hypothetical protein
MRDICEATEQLTGLLAMRLENATRRRGWAVKPTGRVVAPSRGRLTHLVSTMVLLPRGDAANFLPRPEAEPDGLRWLIDIRRSDGVMRKIWASGLEVARLPQGGYALHYQGAPVRDEALDAILDALAKPGPTGVALWVRKVWAIRFGHLPMDLSETLERIHDPDRLDQIHSAILSAVDRAEAEAQFLRIANAPQEPGP